MFITIPTAIFLAVSGVLFFFRQPMNTGTASPGKSPEPTPELAVQDTTPVISLIDSLEALPDSLNPFIQQVDLDEPTERALAVQQCGTCHQRAYQNWKDGPHANSFKSMRKLYETATDTSIGYFPKAYGNWLHQNMSICFQCHTSQNLFETNFKGVELVADQHLINDSLFPDLHKFAKPRTDPRTFSTGTDCFTCHYNGERIITGPDFKPDPTKAEMPGYCNPLPTPFFTTNTNCYSCHHFSVETMEENIARGLEVPEKSCIRCHQNYDEQGNRTHYDEWRFADHKRHPVHAPKGGLFETIDINVTKGEPTRLTLDWYNAASPHALSECGEIVLEVLVRDQRGHQVLKEDIRLNRKAEHDPDLRTQLDGGDPPGEFGHAFDPCDAPLREEFTLEGEGIRSGRIYLTAIDKAQYWGDDRIGVKIYRKEIAF